MGRYLPFVASFAEWCLLYTVKVILVSTVVGEELRDIPLGGIPLCDDSQNEKYPIKDTSETRKAIKKSFLKLCPSVF